MDTKQFIKAHAQKGTDGRIRFIASDETVDRSGESIPISQWDLSNFKKSPRILVDHDYRVQSIVAKAPNTYVEGKTLVTEPEFHEITQIARDTRDMVESGVLDTMSVGFLRKMDEKGVITNELMEISFVAVPCNPNARMLSMKSVEFAEKMSSFLGEEVKEEDVKPDEAPEAPPADAPKEDEPKPAEEPTDAPAPAPEAEAPKEEEAKPEEKGMTEELLAAHSELCQQKYPYIDALYFAAWNLTDAYMLDTAPVDSFPKLLAEMMEKLGNISVSDAKSNEEVAQKMIGFLTTRGVQNIAAKAGRVISSKNRGIIETSIDAMRQATAALEELLTEADSEGDDSKGQEATPKKSNNAEVDALEAYAQQRAILRGMATILSEGLSKLKFPRN